ARPFEQGNRFRLGDRLQERRREVWRGDRFPPRSDRVLDRFRPFDHDLVHVLANRVAHALEPGVIPARDHLDFAPMILKPSAGSALWTFPSILLSAFVIAWGAEAAQFLISQGLALAILAWMQTLPEFAVEAVIAWQAGKDLSKTHLVIANFTGSLRLLVGLGWPMIYFVAAASRRKFINIDLEDEHAVEVFGLLLPIVYFTFIWWKGTLTIWDAFPLAACYFVYLWVLWKIPPRSSEGEALEDLGVIPRRMLMLPPMQRNIAIWIMFIAGGSLLYFAAHPFLNSMLALATSLGVSTFVFVQWVAPFLSEFPEKLSAFYWAR